MDDNTLKLYQLSDKEKEELVKNLSQDVTFLDEELPYEIDLENDSFLDEVG